MTNEWRSVRSLEFDKVREMLATHCPTDGSRQMALSLLPSDDAQEMLEQVGDLYYVIRPSGIGEGHGKIYHPIAGFSPCEDEMLDDGY